MKFQQVKRYLTIIIMAVACQTGFAKDVETPLITVQVDNLVRESFHSTMLTLSENPNRDVTSFAGGFSLLGPLGILADASYLKFKNINDWLSIPLSAAGGIGFTGRSLYLGSGIIFKNCYFDLGLTAGLYTSMIRMTDNFTIDAEEESMEKFDFGVFPVLNTAGYPWLSFIEKLSGFVYSNEPKTSDIKFDSLNFLVNVAFKQLFRLSVLELYTYKGVNNFIPGYDLSNYLIRIENSTFYNSTTGDNYDIGGNIARISRTDAKMYKTLSYGLRIGGEHFVADLNYLTIIDHLVTYDPDKNDYVDYKYPYGLNGFPSVTFNFYLNSDRSVFEVGKFGCFLRFSTLNQFGQPYLPDIGFFGKSDELAVYCTWTFPSSFGISVRSSITN